MQHISNMSFSDKQNYYEAKFTIDNLTNYKNVLPWGVEHFTDQDKNVLMKQAMNDVAAPSV